MPRYRRPFARAAYLQAGEGEPGKRQGCFVEQSGHAKADASSGAALLGSRLPTPRMILSLLPRNSYSKGSTPTCPLTVREYAFQGLQLL